MTFYNPLCKIIFLNTSNYYFLIENSIVFLRNKKSIYEDKIKKHYPPFYWKDLNQYMLPILFSIIRVAIEHQIESCELLLQYRETEDCLKIKFSELIKDLLLTQNDLLLNAGFKSWTPAIARDLIDFIENINLDYNMLFLKPTTVENDKELCIPINQVVKDLIKHIMKEKSEEKKEKQSHTNSDEATYPFLPFDDDLLELRTQCSYCSSIDSDVDSFTLEETDDLIEQPSLCTDPKPNSDLLVTNQYSKSRSSSSSRPF